MYKEMDKFEDAIVLWERCRALALQEGEKEDYTHVVMYHKLGDAYAMTHNNDQARKMFEKCLEIAEADSEEAVEARDMLAAIYGEQNDFERAIPLRTANLQIAVDSGDGETEGWVLHELGQDLVRLKDWPKAKEMNARCLEVAKALGLAELENLTYHQRAWVHYMQEENEAAIAMFEKSFALAMRRGDAKQQHLEYRVLAGVYVYAARYQDARHIYVKDAETMTARMARENLVGHERFEALKLLCKSALGLGTAYQLLAKLLESEPMRVLLTRQLRTLKRCLPWPRPCRRNFRWRRQAQACKDSRSKACASSSTFKAKSQKR